MDQRIINLFDEYTHKPLSREVFLSKLAKLTGSTAAAIALLPMLEVNYAHAVTVTENDDDLIIEEISYKSDDTTVKGYLPRPKSSKKLGSVIVIHENRGLNPHTKDVARRVAKEGYMALAVDALSPFGGTPANEDEARTLIGKLDMKKNLNNYLEGFNYLKSRKESNGKTACVGFCWGGAMANQLAVNSNDLKAAVAFYGRQADASDAPKIKARLMLHYGEMDERVNAGIPVYEEALKAANIDYQLFIYKGAQHAFMNDTAPTRFHPKSAKLAWDRTIQLFKQTIS